MVKDIFINNNVRQYDIEKVIKNLQSVPDINECEYIFIDILNFSKSIPFLENKIIITQNNLNDFLMLEYESEETNSYNEMTKTNFNMIVDLVILLDSENIPKKINELVDEDTIISKNLGNDVTYVEDLRNNQQMICTKYEKIVLEGNGVNTHIKYYEEIPLKANN